MDHQYTAMPERDNRDMISAGFSDEEKATYKDSTYEIVSKVAYLIGVPHRIFENEHEAPKMEYMRVLSKIRPQGLSDIFA